MSAKKERTAASERRASARRLRWGRVWVSQKGAPGERCCVPLVDISGGGVFLRSPVPVTPGQEVSMKIFFANKPEVIATAKVIRHTSGVGFAGRFIEMDTESVAALNYWLGPDGAVSDGVDPNREDVALVATASAEGKPTRETRHET